jgi:neurexin
MATYPLLLLLLPLTSPFILEGSDVSYAKFLPLRFPSSRNTTSTSILLEFNTNQPDGLILYTDSPDLDQFIELKLVEGSLRLRFNINSSGTQVITVGRHLNDGLWHRVDVKVDNNELALTVDGFVTQSRNIKGNSRGNTQGGEQQLGFVYVGGLPVQFNEKIAELSLPSVVFEPRFRGAVRNIIYSGQHKPQDIVEAKVCILFFAGCHGNS